MDAIEVELHAVGGAANGVTSLAEAVGRTATAAGNRCLPLPLKPFGRNLNRGDSHEGGGVIHPFEE
ncbi:hypothetical protein, partial [uncultured Jannaschia sp.]|uniref:hypothetical protein n=1 Tax=uncultured Jannaschia sp. TaxID=293347 RepID=UPI002632E16C